MLNLNIMVILYVYKPMFVKEKKYMKKKLYKLQNGKKIFGVCGGIAEYFDIDPTIVRLIWIFLIFCAGTGILAYIVAALIMPNKSEVM